MKEEGKIIIAYLVAITLPLTGIFLMWDRSESPYNQLIGNWIEVRWDYENTGPESGDSLTYQNVKNEARNFSGQELTIHRFEMWHFFHDGTLKLVSQAGTRTVEWKLKGRGNILEIRDGKQREYYNIMAMNKDTLTIYYNSDLELKGIAKLIFKRT